LDCCVKFISENAYIQVAINSVNFCEGAKNAFYLCVRNPATYSASNMVGWIMGLLGKGAIVGGTGYLTILFVQFKFPGI